MFLASGRIEFFSSHDGFKPGHERLQLAQHAFSPHGTLVAAPTANEEDISKHLTEPFERPAHGRLTQKAPFCRACHVLFFQQRMERNQEVQVDIP
jgi:hypothetical protein